MDPNAPLLFFDSGVGGLSVLGPTRALLPLGAQAHLSSGVMDKAGVPAAADVEPGCSRLLPCGQDLPDGRARKRRGSKNQISMTPPVTAAAIQQAAARAGA